MRTFARGSISFRRATSACPDMSRSATSTMAARSRPAWARSSASCPSAVWAARKPRCEKWSARARPASSSVSTTRRSASSRSELAEYAMSGRRCKAGATDGYLWGVRRESYPQADKIDHVRQRLPRRSSRKAVRAARICPARAPRPVTLAGLRSVDSVFLQSPVERPARETKRACRFGTVVPVNVEGPQDEIALRLRERRDSAARRARRHGYGRRRRARARHSAQRRKDRPAGSARARPARTPARSGSPAPARYPGTRTSST